MITLRPSAQRGHVQFDWLNSRHSFSFGSYYDPRFMGFGHLRVINEDVIDAGMGFGTHGHRNMEIITYVLDGVLAHKDSTGGQGEIKPDEVQVMSAGRGIHHSEMNGSATADVHLLQIWLLPREGNTQPGYAQRHFPRQPGLTLLVSPDGRDASLPIRQDADLSRALIGAGERLGYALRRRRAWVQVARGTLRLNGAELHPGDGASVEDLTQLVFEAVTDAEVLIFDLL